MKIIAVDNFDKETRKDILVAENIKSKIFGEIMVNCLNDKLCDHPDAPLFFKLVEDDCRLHEWKP